MFSFGTETHDHCVGHLYISWFTPLPHSFVDFWQSVSTCFQPTGGGRWKNLHVQSGLSVEVYVSFNFSLVSAFGFHCGDPCPTLLCLHVFTEFAFIDTWNFAKAPSSLRGAEGRWRCLRLLVASFVSIHQTLSLGSCAATVQRAPGHNRWGVSETTLPAKTQGRTLDCPFNFPPPRVAGWLFMCRCQVCNRAAVALVATGPRRGAL